MNLDYSIENSAEKIQNVNTRTYFKEVYQTYINGNYRSSIVMLYSVLICDLVYKLRDLRDIYKDTKAKKILEEIEIIQKNNSNSPEWESKLVELIKTRTSLLEPSDIVSIESLQKFRHLSAHPVINNADLLYSPNKDTVQALIRNILDGVLINPPFFSNKIFDTLLSDLIEVKDKITDDDALDRYVKSRYLNRLKESDFKKVFRSLWKVVFITNDELSNQNRTINYKVLKVFILSNREICLDSITNDPHYFSNINADESVSRLITLLAIFPDIFGKLDPPLIEIINGKVEQDDDYKIIAWFLKGNLKDHLNQLKDNPLPSISIGAFNFMKKLCQNNSCYKELLDYIIEYFALSNNFDMTLQRYNSFIHENANDFSLDQTLRLLTVSNENSQIYNRIGMRNKLQSIVNLYEDSVDIKDYPKLFKN